MSVTDEKESKDDAKETKSASGEGKSKSKGEERRSKKDKKSEKPPTKVIIRRLPPSMNEEHFLEQVDLPEHDYFYFAPADRSLGVMASARAYINFKNPAEVFLFKDRFDGYIFVDGKGAEYPAVVEYAPFQGLPKGKSRKKDVKCNTIESDTHYLRFLESLRAEETEAKAENKLEYSYQIKDDEKITSTPLLEFIANKRREKIAEKKRKAEEKKRQREEEREKKKNKVAKAMPESIKEEEGAGGGGDGEIMVRTVPSRLDPKQRDNKREKDVKPTRAEERDRKRKDQKQKRDGKHQRDVEETKKAPPVRAKHPPPPSVAPVDSPPKREVKKYSERRRETRARAEIRLQEAAEKNPAPDSLPKEGLTAEEAPPEPELPPPIEIKDDSPVEPTEEQLRAAKEAEAARRAQLEEKRRKEKEERKARRIKNKDRPSLEIYRPRSARLAANFPGSDSEKTRASDSDVKPVIEEEKRPKEKRQGKDRLRTKKVSREEVVMADLEEEKFHVGTKGAGESLNKEE